FGEEFDSSGDFGGDAAAVLQHEGVLVHGGGAGTVRDDAREGHRGGCRNEGPFVVSCTVAGRAGLGDGRFLGELLARDPGDEPAAANVGAKVDRGEDPDQLKPGWSGILSREAVAKHDAVAGQKLLAPAEQIFVPVGWLGLAGKPGPAAHWRGAAMEGLLPGP